MFKPIPRHGLQGVAGFVDDLGLFFLAHLARIKVVLQGLAVGPSILTSQMPTLLPALVIALGVVLGAGTSPCRSAARAAGRE